MIAIIHREFQRDARGHFYTVLSILVLYFIAMAFSSYEEVRIFEVVFIRVFGPLFVGLACVNKSFIHENNNLSADFMLLLPLKRWRVLLAISLPAKIIRKAILTCFRGARELKGINCVAQQWNYGRSHFTALE